MKLFKNSLDDLVFIGLLVVVFIAGMFFGVTVTQQIAVKNKVAFYNPETGGFQFKTNLSVTNFSIYAK